MWIEEFIVIIEGIALLALGILAGYYIFREKD